MSLWSKKNTNSNNNAILVRTLLNYLSKLVKSYLPENGF